MLHALCVVYAQGGGSLHCATTNACQDVIALGSDVDIRETSNDQYELVRNHIKIGMVTITRQGWGAADDDLKHLV